MDKYQTKEEVFAKFGTPTEKIMSASSEEWIYDYAKKASAKTKDKGNEKESGDGVFNFSDNKDNTNTTKMSYFNESKRYIKFTFDLKGSVTKWDTQKVYLTERVKSRGKTLGLVILIIVGAVGFTLGLAAMTLPPSTN